MIIDPHSIIDCTVTFKELAFTVVPELASTVVPEPASAAAVQPPVLDWRRFEVLLHRDQQWWAWDRGIVNLKALYPLQPNASSGVRLRTALEMVKWVVLRRDCQFKVGMTTCLGTRWLIYNDREANWKPSHMFVLLPVQRFEAAGWSEAGLIRACRELRVDIHMNMNLAHRDAGGTGNNSFPDAVRWIYVAALPTAND